MRPCLALLLLAFVLLATPRAGAAQAPARSPAELEGGGILVAPTRIVLDDRKRTGEVTLSNVGRRPCSYRISLIRMEMDENGGLAERPFEPRPDGVDIKAMLRFSPRQVTLDPQEAQLVRIQVRRPADLPAGEYRVHMLFREEAPPPPEPSGKPQEAPKAISIQVKALFGVSIPVIIRHGQTSAQVAITGLALDRGRKLLSFRIERTGNQSVHGNLRAAFLPASGKAPQPLAEANALSVYTPNAFRNMTLGLGTAGLPQGPGRIHVTYTAPEDSGSGLLAEAFLDLP